MPLLRCLLLLACLSACSPSCGNKSPAPASPPVPPPPPSLPESSLPLLQEPSLDEIHQLGLSTPPEYDALSQSFLEALSLQHNNLEALSQQLGYLSQNYPFHSLAESAAFAHLLTLYSLQNCENLLNATASFVQNWPHGPFAPEAWLLLASCQPPPDAKETLLWLALNFPHSPAGLKAKCLLSHGNPETGLGRF